MILQNLLTKIAKHQLGAATTLNCQQQVGLCTVLYIDGYMVPSDGHGTRTIK
jgi:hypothetical protein